MVKNASSNLPLVLLAPVGKINSSVSYNKNILTVRANKHDVTQKHQHATRPLNLPEPGIEGPR